jgi:hypothetical protein
LCSRINIQINFLIDTGGKFATGINNPSWYWWQNFAAGVIDTGGKVATGVADIGGVPSLANNSAN